MSKASDHVFMGFMRLNEGEQMIVIKQINDYLEKGSIKKKEIKEGLEKVIGVILGPTGGGCPCCGR